MKNASVLFGFGNINDPGIEPGFTKKQVHGVAAVKVHELGQHYGEADAFWTDVPGLTVSVTTADCVPILLKRKDGLAVAAIHAGWRGTYARIVERFFDDKNGSEWTAMLGPSIRSCCYEVSKDLIVNFKNEFASMPENRIEPKPQHLDLIEVNLHQLRNSGVKIESVHSSCTFCACHPDGSPIFYSYRRGDRFSRQFSWITRQD